METPGSKLGAAIASSAIQIPGAPNALVARMIEKLGFRAAYLSGASLSTCVHALPDVGLFTLTELVQQVSCLTSRISIPLIVDADTGFGHTMNVERTVALLERAGAAGIQLEDQSLPKRCGHLSGKTLVNVETMCEKVRAACAARIDKNLVIIARTDARDVEGFEKMIQRSLKYIEAGANWIFPESLATRDEFATFVDLVRAPLIANMTEFGKSPLLSFSELEQLGYRAVIYPVTLQRVAMKAMENALTTLCSEGHQRPLLERMQTRQELYDLIEYQSYEHRDQQYFA